jgi:Matrixin
MRRRFLIAVAPVCVAVVALSTHRDEPRIEGTAFGLTSRHAPGRVSLRARPRTVREWSAGDPFAGSPRRVADGDRLSAVADFRTDGTRVRSGTDEHAETRRLLRTEGRGTYIDEMLARRDSSLARWPDRRDDPLRVWVQHSVRLAGWQFAFVARVRDAFVEWDSVGLPVPFTFVDDSAAADVHVTWRDHFEEPISGRTIWSRDEQWWIVGGNIELALHHQNGDPLDPEAIRALALHEVGHLLGLDHTADPHNIMCARVTVRDLSEEDRATARLLYSLPAGAIR